MFAKLRNDPSVYGWIEGDNEELSYIIYKFVF